MTSLQLAQLIRADALRMTAATKASHIGSCLSIADILAVLYGDVLRVDANNPLWPQRDRMFLSKGHAAAGLYACLAARGFIEERELESYCADGSRLLGHASHHVPGVELSTGSLGHALSVATGFALACKRLQQPQRAFVVLSDGECDEGSVWEALLFAGHHALDNLCVIVDYNKIQSFGLVKDILNLEPFADKWRAFRFAVQEVDGHDHDALKHALMTAALLKGQPSVIIAHTIKGKGVGFMHDKLAWHYRSPSDDEYAQAIQEIEDAP